jgi:RNA polymerase primary sigma factor
LDERERVIIESYFGINTDCEAMTLEAIGEKYGLTKERIRQIKEKAIRKLRHNAQNLFSLINE